MKIEKIIDEVLDRIKDTPYEVSSLSCLKEKEGFFFDENIDVCSNELGGSYNNSRLLNADVETELLMSRDDSKNDRYYPTTRIYARYRFLSKPTIVVSLEQTGRTQHWGSDYEERVYIYVDSPEVIKILLGLILKYGDKVRRRNLLVKSLRKERTKV